MPKNGWLGMRPATERPRGPYIALPSSSAPSAERPRHDDSPRSSRRLSTVLSLFIGFVVGVFALHVCGAAFPSHTLRQILLGRLRASSSIPLPERPAPRITRVASLAAPGEHGSFVDLQVLRWYSNATQKDETVRFCHFRNLCVQHYAPRGRPAAIAYFLASNATVEHFPSVSDLSKHRGQQQQQHLQDCLRTWKSPQLSFGLRDLSKENAKGSVHWVNGSTFGTPKGEYRNHPFSWHMIWAAFSSAVPAMRDYLASDRMMYPVSAERFFDNYQLLGESFSLNGWTQFIMQIATQTARRALSRELSVPRNGDNDLGAPHARSLSIAPVYRDDRVFREGHSDSSITCFEEMITIQPSRHFYRDASDAALFRSTAFASLGLPLERQRACRLEELNVLLWLRDDRPLWGREALRTALTELGLRVRDVSVAEETPYADQVALFADADIVVSVHGSHLQNMVFLRPGAVLVEVYPTLFYHGGQRSLADKVGEIDYIEIAETQLVPEALVRGHEGASKGWLHKWAHVKQMTEKHPTLAECTKHRDCLLATREFGAYVPPEVLNERLEGPLARLACEKGCRE